MSLGIWCNTVFNPGAAAALAAGCAAHRLVVSATASAAVLAAGRDDPALLEAEVAFGQPPVEALFRAERLRWVQVSTAGYTRFDRADLQAHFAARGIAFTTSSSVFADSCAQHVLAMMLALGRQLPQSWRDQAGERGWNYEQRRYDSRLLTGQTVLIVGHGTIGRRLVELLAPFRMTIGVVRRRAAAEGGDGVEAVPPGAVDGWLARADHVVNLLPDNPSTRGWFGADRFAAMRPGARFYNVGRGTTVDAAALLATLRSGRLGGAYLDVFDPEPLPPEHPLWSAPNCWITPHTAGGRHDQDEALVAHFLENLARRQRGEPLLDRVV